VGLDNGDDISQNLIGFYYDRNSNLRNGSDGNDSRFDISVVSLCFLCGGCGGLDSFSGDDFDRLSFLLENGSSGDSIFSLGANKDNSHSFYGSIVNFDNGINFPLEDINV